MAGLSATVILTFLVVVIAQTIGISILPKTQGFTNIGYALGAAAAFILSLAAMARLIQSGVNLGILIPLMASTIPLASVVIGIFVYGESASLPKVGLLVVACILVGVASRY